MNKHNSKDPRALSGGETSFATICLLLSIWECVACPLRCLDEFDVFMDAHNRKLAMSLLVSCPCSFSEGIEVDKSIIS